jgi:hypothetical protein
MEMLVGFVLSLRYSDSRIFPSDKMVEFAIADSAMCDGDGALVIVDVSR